MDEREKLLKAIGIAIANAAPEGTGAIRARVEYFDADQQPICDWELQLDRETAEQKEILKALEG